MRLVDVEAKHIPFEAKTLKSARIFRLVPLLDVTEVGRDALNQKCLLKCWYQKQKAKY